jgi:hypothetical protein
MTHLVQAGTGIGYGDPHPLPDQSHIDADIGAFFLRGDGIFDRVLDQRLEQQRGQRARSARRRSRSSVRRRSSKRIFSISR